MGLISKWTSGEREAPAPLEGPVIGTVIAGTLLWFVGFLVLVPFYGSLADDGHTWWMWTCLAGSGLGLFGLWYARRREAAIRRDAERAAARDTTGGATGGTTGGTTGGGTGDASPGSEGHEE